jgi:hypothetical protein
MKTLLLASLSGALFGFGLGLSGMANPDKVLNFLDLAGQWDPSLAFVMGGALLVALPGYAWARRRRAPDSPAAGAAPGRIDPPLLIGSALFGIGWGIVGLCPGPAFANLARGSGEALIFVAAMLAGSQLGRWVTGPAAGKGQRRE